MSNIVDIRHHADLIVMALTGRLTHARPLRVAVLDNNLPWGTDLQSSLPDGNNTFVICDADIVYVSDLLAKAHRIVASALRNALGDRLRVIPGTKDIWCRDYMPAEIVAGRYVQFRYRPAYLKRLPHLRTGHAAALLRLRNCTTSRLVVDGGNIVRQDGTAVVTDRIYHDNPRVGRPALRRRLREELAIDKLIVIPAEPGDVLAHADGVLRFVDARTLLVNDCRKAAPAYGRAVEAMLHHYGFAIVRCPYRPTNAVGPDGIPSAVGVYVNFLQTDGMVFCPVFGQKADDRAMRLLEKVFPKSRVNPVNCRELADRGGVLNCVTWNRRLKAVTLTT